MRDDFNCLLTRDQEEYLVDKIVSTITFLQAEEIRLRKKKQELNKVLEKIRAKKQKEINK